MRASTTFLLLVTKTVPSFAGVWQAGTSRGCIAVAEGQEVKAGETVAVVEAMKMENVLRAERDGVVKKIHAKPGDSLAVDAVIVEFT